MQAGISYEELESGETSDTKSLWRKRFVQSLNFMKINFNEPKSAIIGIRTPVQL